MRVRSLFIGFAATGLVLAACNLGTTGVGGPLDGPIWVLTSYADGGADKPVPVGVVVDARFDGATSTVGGSAGCNTYSGPYTAQGSSLTFGDLATTLMLCDGPAGEVETAYIANLAAARSYTVTADALTIFDGSGATILAYAATDRAAIGGVTWHATGINNGRQGVESVVAGTDPTMTYDPAGTVAGNAGCNTYSGAATVDGTSIRIGPLASTRMACVDEAANTQEAAFLAALENATTFERRGNTLELRDDAGALQVMFEGR